MKGNKRGKESDEALLKVINEYPGLSQYELARKLRWHSGRVDGAVRRLLNANKIIIRVMERNGRRVNLIYPKEEKPRDIIEIPAEVLERGNPEWRGRAFFYALDSSTIGVSGYELPEWKEIAIFVEDSPIMEREGKVILKIPEKLYRFYGLERKHRVVSKSGNNLLITISGEIIEEKRYP